MNTGTTDTATTTDYRGTVQENSVVIIVVPIGVVVILLILILIILFVLL